MKQVTKIPTLEVPNLVQNLGAALMGYVSLHTHTHTLQNEN